MSDTIIYSWPPVCARGVEFTQVQPYSESLSAFGQKTRYVSQHERERKVATVVASGMYNDGAAGGYINMFKRLMKVDSEGRSLNLVRLQSRPSHWNLRWGGTRGQTEMDWTATGRDFDWTATGTEMVWYEGDILSGVSTADGSYDALQVSGLTPNEVAAYPDEIVTVGNSTARVLKLEYADSEGSALVRLDGPLPSGDMTIGEYEEDIYKITSVPRTVQYAGQDYEYTFEFEQVYEDEIVGTYTEENPWR